ncbi:hypothetical protein SAY86_011599 [Trapa natans]|uniref:Protein kinase domain-containing protein n=1 Tax=Trapa natans TaxID=22666 RepID=A0AAN7LKH8_TRANT|nr:hypothetical protein SAY86_011599 [Trapa natans]
MEALTLQRAFFTLLLLSLLLAPSPSWAVHCNSTDEQSLNRAFSSVSGFNISWLLPATASSSLSSSTNCTIRSIVLPAKNLSGTISWRFLRNMSRLQSIDLSSNSLQGSIPRWLWWSFPALSDVNLSDNQLGGRIIGPSNRLSPVQSLDLSGNRFTNSVNMTGFQNLRALDLSGNDLRILPYGLGGLSKLEQLNISGCRISGALQPISGLRNLKRLDVSNNSLTGNFPGDFPPMSGLDSLNVSFNNFTVRVRPENFAKFGKSAFTHAGRINFNVSKAPNDTTFPLGAPVHPFPSANHSVNSNPSTRDKHTQQQHQKQKSKSGISKALILGVSCSSASLLATAAVLAGLCYRRKKLLARRNKWAISKPTQLQLFKIEKSGPFTFETESGTSWVADIREPTAAAVVMFEKPLMSLTFKDLIAATSHFGKESLLAEGRCGPIYRAVLPGDLHVAIKVLESARAVGHDDAAAAFEGLYRLKHPNLVPISGYCIAGKEKLVLSEFMPGGDLHQWLHELPVGETNVEDWSNDTWELHPDPTASSSPEKTNWAVRHRVAVGVARGLAYLHHAAGTCHGHLVPSNILLADDLEPRISDFGLRDIGTSVVAADTPGDVGFRLKEDVYSFGMVLVELLTGRPGDEESLAWARHLIRTGRAEEAVDGRLMMHYGGDFSREMVETLRVGYLCTAESPEKRPTMQQVLGLLKDIRS